MDVFKPRVHDEQRLKTGKMGRFFTLMGLPVIAPVTRTGSSPRPKPRGRLTFTEGRGCAELGGAAGRRVALQ